MHGSVSHLLEQFNNWQQHQQIAAVLWR